MKNLFVLTQLLYLFFACAKQPPVEPPAGTRRLLAEVQMRPGGPLRKNNMFVYRALVAPPSLPAADAPLEDGDLVLGISFGGETVAYPIRYLLVHEVINDQIGDRRVVITWCPLTGSGVVYLREHEGKELTFDFAEGLMNNNLLIVDRETSSLWPQLKGRAVAGPLEGRPLKVFPALQATWGFWRSRYPQSRVVTDLSPGQSYLYDDWEPGGAPALRPRKHDLSALGLGLHLDGISWFFPFKELRESNLPVRLENESQEVRVFYDREGLTAWAEGPDGNLLPGMLAYSFGWFDFYPDSRRYSAP